MKSIYNDEYKIFVNLLKEHRISKKLNQGELAEKLGWANHTYVSKMELFERRIDVIEFRNICFAIGISPIEFMQEFEERLKEEN